MRLLAALWALLLAVSAVRSQTTGANGTCPVCFNCNARGCANFGECRSGACFCPDGFGDSDCSLATCGSLLAPADKRPVRAAGATCTCDGGFTGPNCNVCTNNDVCTKMPGRLVGTTYICNNGTKVWRTNHHTACTVKNPTLAGLFPGFTQLSMKRDLIAGSTIASLWYLNDPQFTCNITQCEQSWSSAATTWSCKDVSCKCNAGTKFCGGGGILDLTNSINTAKGMLNIVCDESTPTCNVAFEFLSGILPQGIALDECKFGECVDETASPLSGDSGQNVKTINTFGYVGLGFAGAAIAALLISLLIGCVQQRRHMHAPLLTEKPGVAISFKDVSYSIGQNVILSDISGEVPAGTMLAIMGPSGAGKSSLIDILAGKRKSGKIKGSIVVGDNMPLSSLRGISGFVDQEDVFQPTMTVREVIEFSAALRLPESITVVERRQRVQNVLDELGLSHIAESRVGDSLARGISGGEKRRLSIGVELVTNPSVLFLDEPTSGLDSYNAIQVMETLAGLAHKSGRTVVFSIHQPRSDVFARFDQILLLSKGSVVFFGASKHAAAHFADRGLPCPEGYNLADHLIDVATKHPDDARADTSSTAHSSDESRELRRRNLSESAQTLRDGSGAAMVASAVVEKSSPDNQVTVITETPAQPAAVSSTDLSARPRLATSFLTQLSTLLRRSRRHFWRKPGLFFAHTAIALVLGVFMGGLYWKSDSSLGGIQNRLGSIFFIQSLIGFSSLSAISTFTHEKLLFMRERSNGYYGAGPFFISKLLFDIVPLRIIPGIILTTIPFFMIGYTSGVDYYLRYMAIMVVFAGNCGLFCLAIGCAISEYGTAVLVASISLLFQMLFAGLLVNQVQITPALRWLQYLSFFKYAFEAVAVNDASGLRFVDQISGVEIGVAASVVLGKFGIDMDGYWRDFTISVGLFLALTTIVCLLVTFKLRERR
ncbi:hypothetical protein HK105_201822 [Polyrhizophydium stewartii]|uniref:ABC transporter domain-containing protein n=1 Tax=Polyrhizophydium stewartii TaxID=2732419 RepID=A0ABR4NFW8_9FUNG